MLQKFFTVIGVAILLATQTSCYPHELDVPLDERIQPLAEYVLRGVDENPVWGTMSFSDSAYGVLADVSVRGLPREPIYLNLNDGTGCGEVNVRAENPRSFMDGFIGWLTTEASRGELHVLIRNSETKGARSNVLQSPYVSLVSYHDTEEQVVACGSNPRFIDPLAH